MMRNNHRRTPLIVATVAAVALLVTSGLVVGGCSEGAEHSGNTTADETAETIGKEMTQKVDVEELTLNETAALLVIPAPSEIVAIMERDEAFRGLATTPVDALPSYADLPSWQRALTVGRVVADLLIAAPEASDATVAAYLENLVDGLRLLGADEDRIAEVRDLQSRVAEGGVDRDQLLQRFDRFRAEIFKTGDQQIGEQNVVLIAVGGWARAVNVVSNLAQETGQVPPGADILKLRIIVSTLLDKMGSEEEVAPVVESLRSILPVTANIPSAPRPEELQTLIDETDEILALTRVS